MRRVWAGAWLVVVVAACGGGSLSLSEYTAQALALATVMEERIGTLDAEWDTQTSTVEGARTYWGRRLKARVESLEGLQALDSPVEVAELHRTALDLLSRLIAAEEALAVRVASFETITEPGQWWDTVEGKAARSIDEEADAICHVFQARYDATIERLAFSDVAWIPSEMKKIVQIDLGC